MKRLAAWVCAFLLSLPAAAGQERRDESLKLSQGALGSTVPDLRFATAQGEPVALANFRGKPLLVTLVYTACADVCPTLIESLYPAAKEAQSALGGDSFSIITVGFDIGKDTPERMRTFASARNIHLDNWHFLSGDEQNIDALARAVGFGIYGRAGGYDHIAQVSIIDGEGRVYKQVYGATFDAPLIVEPLKDLVLGRYRPVESVQGLLDRIKLFCTTYDPNTGRYYFNYSLFIGAGIGLASLSLVFFALIREWRRSVRHTHGHG